MGRDLVHELHGIVTKFPDSQIADPYAIVIRHHVLQVVLHHAHHLSQQGQFHLTQRATQHKDHHVKLLRCTTAKACYPEGRPEAKVKAQLRDHRLPDSIEHL